MQRRSLSRAWTEAERDEFRRMWLGGASLIKISSRLRRSKNSIERQRQVLGRRPGPRFYIARKSKQSLDFAEARQGI